MIGAYPKGMCLGPSCLRRIRSVQIILPPCIQHQEFADSHKDKFYFLQDQGRLFDVDVGVHTLSLFLSYNYDNSPLRAAILIHALLYILLSLLRVTSHSLLYLDTHPHQYITKASLLYPSSILTSPLMMLLSETLWTPTSTSNSLSWSCKK